jgi:hypothetical protein
MIGMTFLILKERLSICYTKAKWNIFFESDNQIIFKSKIHGNDVYYNENEVPEMNSTKISHLTCVKSINHENEFIYSVYFFYKNKLYAYCSSFFNEVLDERFYYIKENGAHVFEEDIDNHLDIRDDLQEEFKILSKFNIQMFEKIPEFRLLLITGNYKI